MSWVAAEHSKGRTFTDIANELGTSVQMLRRRYRASGRDIQRSGGKPIHKSVHNLSDEEIDDVVSRNRRGESIKSIANDLGVSNQMLGRKLKSLGISVERQKPPIRSAGSRMDNAINDLGASRDDVIRMYSEDRMSVKKIAQHFNVGVMTVSKYLKESGVEIVPVNMSKKADLLLDYGWLSAEYSSGRTAQDISNELGVNIQTVINYLRGHGIEVRGPGQGTPLGEIWIRDLLDGYGIEYIPNSRDIIPPYELDVYIPSKNMAIEFNGVFWHSERFKDSDYHYIKWRECNKKGIQLLQIWEDDWVERRDIVESMLSHKLGMSVDRVFARKTEVVIASTKASNDLLDKHHIQGSVGAKVKLGLEHNGELVAVMLFKDRGNGEYELVRYATSKAVVGGFSKLLKHFTSNYDYESIVSFADLCVSDGGVYESNGFMLDKVIPPDYSYLSGNIRVHKFSFRKSRFKNDKFLRYEDGLTERELAALNSLDRIYDAGKLRYVLSKE